MKHLVLVMLACFSLHAQVRKELPLLDIAKKPMAVLKGDINGWSYSLDGQWLSEKQQIPVKAISRNDDAYKSKPAKLGLDNFDEYRLYEVQYGQKALVLLVKFYEDGAYRYPQTRKNWEDQSLAFYALFDQSDLDKLSKFNAEKTESLRINLLDDGEVRASSKSKALSRVMEKLLVRPNHNRKLILTARSYSSTPSQPGEAAEKIQFQLYSLLPGEGLVMGVVQDFTKMGQSLYGSEQLLDHLYYECDKSRFAEFFALNKPN